MTISQMPEAPLEALSKAPTEVFGYAIALARHAREGWERVAELEAALDACVHANEDLIDDYLRINNACNHAKSILPAYDAAPLHTDYCSRSGA